MLELEEDIEVVGEAEDAEQALRALDSIAVHVVLMDIQLPGIDGLEATRRLKEIRPDLTVVALTTFGEDYLELAFNAGVISYLQKSCTREQLVQAVRAARQGQTLIEARVACNMIRELTGLRESQRDSLLTSRQIEILRMVAEGSKYREIAKALFFNERTVHREMRGIFDRLGDKDASHAVSAATKTRIL